MINHGDFSTPSPPSWAHIVRLVQLGGSWISHWDSVWSGRLPPSDLMFLTGQAEFVPTSHSHVSITICPAVKLYHLGVFRASPRTDFPRVLPNPCILYRLQMCFPSISPTLIMSQPKRPDPLSENA